MFGDWDWCDGRTQEQLDRYADWLADIERRDLRLAVIELGAGTAIPTVRHECERRAASTQSPQAQARRRAAIGRVHFLQCAR